MSTCEEATPRRPSDRPEVLVHICVTCREPGAAEGTERPGARLFRALEAELAGRGGDPGLRLVPVECLSVCKRPCTVAVSGSGRWTYIYGDLDPERSPATILDGVTRYAATTDGIVPWRERPEAFRKGVVARIPPVPSLSEAAE